MKKQEFLLWTVVGILVLADLFLIWSIYSSVININKSPVTETPTPTISVTTTPPVVSPSPSSSPSTTPVTLFPNEVNLPVPFLTQAPFNNWSDSFHSETCEESAMVMVKYYLDGKSKIELQDGENDLQGLVKYEVENGMRVDVSLEEMQKVMENYYGIKGGRIITNPTIDQIKSELVNKHAILFPAAGKMLPNPHYRSAGVYHMLVVRGYKDDTFITNDDGTNYGESFAYKQSVLMDALHNWNGKDILTGVKAILVY